MDNEKNILLYDTDKERRLIALFLNGMNNEFFPQCAEMLQPDDFEDAFCKDVWTVMVALAKKHSSVDMTSVYSLAPSMGINLTISELADCDDKESWISYPVELAALLSDMSTRRKMQHALMRQAIYMNDLDRSVTDIIAEARKTLDSAVERMPSDVSQMDVYRQSVQEWQARANGDTSDGILCGFHYLDKRGGLQPSDLNIMTGETSMGKTALAVNIMLNAARNGTAVGVFSLEMSLRQLFARMTSIVSGVSSAKLQYYRLDDGTFQIAFEGAASIAPLPIYYDASRTSNIRMIESGIRRMKLNYGCRLFVVDYVNLISDPKAKEKRLVIGGAANSLKALAVELDVCILLISQMRRAYPGESPVPTISRLKESGDLENAADNIYMVYRVELARERYKRPDMVYPDMSERWSRYDPSGTALIINGKSRNAGIGEFLLGFDKELTKFYELSQPPLMTKESMASNVAKETPPF